MHVICLLGLFLAAFSCPPSYLRHQSAGIPTSSSSSSRLGQLGRCLRNWMHVSAHLNDIHSSCCTLCVLASISVSPCILSLSCLKRMIFMCCTCTKLPKMIKYVFIFLSYSISSLTHFQSCATPEMAAYAPYTAFRNFPMLDSLQLWVYRDSGRCVSTHIIFSSA
jgi:hypothetical protein